MPYTSIKDLPPSTKHLTTKQKRKFMEVFNSMAAEGNSEDIIFPIAMKQAKTRKKKISKSSEPFDSEDIIKATTSDVKKDDKGNLVYRDTKFPGYNKPIRSNRDGKQGMVLVKKDEQIKIVHFGDPSMKDNYSPDANDAFYARHGEESDVFSARYWSSKWLWPRGKLKGKGAKPFYTLKKGQDNLMDFSFENVVNVLQKYFGSTDAPDKTQLIKSSEQDEMVAYEVIYEPNVKDAHGEWMSEDTIQKACDNFNDNLIKGNVKPNLFHLANTELFTIEKTWIQEEIDVKVEQTGEVIKAGTWVGKIKYHDEDLWNLKKAGIIQGVSIGARGAIDKETGEITDVSFDPYEEE